MTDSAASPTGGCASLSARLARAASCCVAPVSSAPRQLLITAVRGYRLLLSPWLGSSCRFEPTCSAYALEALGQHGAWSGSRLTVWRIARCHPWCDGGHDPVPATPPSLFTGLLAASRSTPLTRKKSP